MSTDPRVARSGVSDRPRLLDLFCGANAAELDRSVIGCGDANGLPVDDQINAVVRAEGDGFHLSDYAQPAEMSREI